MSVVSGALNLSVEGLEFGWPGRSVARDCGFEIDFNVNGGRLPIVGRSGIGKSTLLYVLAGLKAATSGRVTWRFPDGHTEIWERQPRGKASTRDLANLRRSRFGFAFQDSVLLPYMTVHENLAYALDLSVEPQSIPADAREERICAALSGVLIPRVEVYSEMAMKYPANLSGGQRRRVALAQAMVTSPTVLFADEPSSGLDNVTRGEVMTVVHDWVDLADEGRPRAFIWVTHHEDPIEFRAVHERIAFTRPNGMIEANVDLRNS